MVEMWLDWIMAEMARFEFTKEGVMAVIKLFKRGLSEHPGTIICSGKRRKSNYESIVDHLDTFRAFRRLGGCKRELCAVYQRRRV